MEYTIISQLKTELQKISNLYVGEYPYDYQFIFNKLPALLIQLGNKVVTSSGKHITYDVIVQTEFILYSNQSLSDILSLQTQIINTLTQTLRSITTCIVQIGDTNIQAGDINQYILPSDTGYNANITVRKLTQQYTIRVIPET